MHQVETSFRGESHRPGARFVSRAFIYLIYSSGRISWSLK